MPFIDGETSAPSSTAKPSSASVRIASDVAGAGGFVTFEDRWGDAARREGLSLPEG